MNLVSKILKGGEKGEKSYNYNNLVWSEESDLHKFPVRLSIYDMTGLYGILSDTLNREEIKGSPGTDSDPNSNNSDCNISAFLNSFPWIFLPDHLPRETLRKFRRLFNN